jgi:ubiquinone/menaquinone biosynthesis C-methylase UbiE
VRDVRHYWDEQASGFDNEPDHGLRDPTVHEAWSALLHAALPPAPTDVTDLGCGTGSLAVLLARSGHRVRGVDLSDAMIAAARAKATAANVAVDFEQGDAAEPPYPPSSTDVVLARHVLWALPDPAQALERWVRLLRPDGRLVLIEGRWSTGAGLTASECQELVLGQRTEAVVQRLTDPSLWGRAIDDERYILTSLR